MRSGSSSGTEPGFELQSPLAAGRPLLVFAAAAVLLRALELGGHESAAVLRSLPVSS